MGRILAIDYGRKRAGLAVTDPDQIIATQLAAVPAHAIWNFLEDYFKKEKVDEVVIGYPRQMNNQASEAVKYINPFIRRFRNLYPDISVELMDERFTSRMAFQAMIDGGLKKKARRDKSRIDVISAVIILQGFLEKRRNKQF